MTAHDHRTYVEGCYRCDLSRDEAGVSSDRTPADVIAGAFSVGRGVTNSPEALAHRVLDALTAAGFRVTPKPDDTTRRQQRADIRLLESWAALFRHNVASGLTESISVADQRTLMGVIDRLAAAYLVGSGEPQEPTDG